MPRHPAKPKAISYRRREEILLAEVFSRPEWTSTAANGKRLQVNTRRAVTAIGEVMAIIKRLPYSHQVELQADLDQLQASSDLLAHVARVFELGKENSERAVKRAETERVAKRKADIEALAKRMFGEKLDADLVKSVGEDLLEFSKDEVAYAYAQSLGFDGGRYYPDKHWELRNAVTGPAPRLALLLATERMDGMERGHSYKLDNGRHCMSFGWLDFEAWRAKKNGGTSPPQVTASKGTS
ncbi:MAG: hypothetical protein HGA71_08385 [Azonexaceae bacterium]|nr:hypothetical protein [Azonexaceae bacterium]